MQGIKNYQEKLFTNFQLSDYVPEHNFYRRLKEQIDLCFLYQKTKAYYGDCGQKSIDPVVFFKLCLVGFLENIISDRKLIQHCSMRLDILFFLGYNIDEALPVHSTLSRTRQLFPEKIFEQVFEHTLKSCVESGLVSGHTQAIDSAFVKANASMDSLELKVPAHTLEDHLQKVRVMSQADRQAKNNKATNEQRSITAEDKELKEIRSRNKRWSEQQDQRPGAKNKQSKYTSNKTHYSPTDPDARISVKPGKARKLNYLCQLAVDIDKNVITYIGAHYAHKKDNQHLKQICNKLQPRLKKSGLLWTTILADAGYSSGENYRFLEQFNLQSYIPPHGTYKGGPEGFTYVKQEDYWLCPNGKKAKFKREKIEKGTLKRYYFTTRGDCKECPLRKTCIRSQHEKKITITAFKQEYDRAINRVKSKYGQYLKSKRQSTVEPAFGTLLNFLGMSKVNTIGIQQAHKQITMAACAYNLKKLLKFNKHKHISRAQELFSFIYLPMSLILISVALLYWKIQFDRIRNYQPM